MFKLGLAVVLIGAVGVCAYFYTQMDEEIRQHAERLIAEKLPAMDAKVGGARRIGGRGIALYDVQLSTPSSHAPGEQVVAIDEIILHGDTELGDLVVGELNVTRVEVKHPKLWLRRQAGGSWNIQSLLPLQQDRIRLPTIVVRSGVVAISDARAGAEQLMLHDVHLTVEATNQDSGGTQPERGPSPAGASPPAVNAATPSMRIQGALSGPQIRRCEFQIQTDGRSQECAARATIQQLQYGPELHSWAAPLLPKEHRQAALSGRIDGQATLHCNFANPSQSEFDVQLDLSDGRIEHPKMPRAITEIVVSSADGQPGGIHLNNAGLTVRRMIGRSETTQIAMSLSRNGWSSRAPLAISAQAGPIRLNSSIRRSLPTILQEQWDKYRPEGVVHANKLEATFDGRKWRPVAVLLTGSELAFESDKFPYRLRDGNGTLRFSPAADQGTVVDISLIGHSGTQPIQIEGQIFDPQPGAAGWAEIKGRDLDIEESMINALDDKARDVIASLNPTGRFDVEWRLERQQPGAEPQTRLRLDLRGVDLDYDKFSYPLKQVRGVIQARDKHWSFENLSSGGRKQIACSGSLRPIGPDAAGSELYLNFSGQQIPLDEALYDAVPDAVKRAWEQLRPFGHFDLQSAEVRFRSGDVKPSISVLAHPREETAGIQPVFFDYELKNLAGSVSYQGGHVQLIGMRAHHEPTLILANGAGSHSDDGAWQFELTELEIDRLMPARRDLLAALPRQLSSIIDQLGPTGAFRISDGRLSFQKSASPIDPVLASWDVLLDCHQTDLQCGIELNNVFGSVRLRGESDGRHSYCAGQFDLESVTFLDYRFNNVQGPFWIDRSQCLLGQYATTKLGVERQRLRGTAYEGVVEADASIKFLSQPKYEVFASLRSAALRQLMLERFGSETQFRGRMDANIRLDGNGRYLEGLAGQGDLRIRDAELYEHSLLVGMLKVLRNKTPDTTAFNQCDVEFRLQGKDVLLDKLNFLGDAVSLKGSGRADYDQRLNLAFYGQVGGRNEKFPIVNQLLGQMSEQTMRMYVSGTIGEPLVRTEAFPAFNQLWEQLQTDWEYPVFGPPRQAQRTGPATVQPNR